MKARNVNDLKSTCLKFLKMFSDDGLLNGSFVNQHLGSNWLGATRESIQVYEDIKIYIIKKLMRLESTQREGVANSFILLLSKFISEYERLLYEKYQNDELLWHELFNTPHKNMTEAEKLDLYEDILKSQGLSLNEAKSTKIKRYYKIQNHALVQVKDKDQADYIVDRPLIEPEVAQLYEEENKRRMENLRTANQKKAEKARAQWSEINLPVVIYWMMEHKSELDKQSSKPATMMQKELKRLLEKMVGENNDRQIDSQLHIFLKKSLDSYVEFKKSRQQ